MERASLSLRIPPELLPSTQRAGDDDSLASDNISVANSVASELRGLQLRPVSRASAHSASRPPAPHQPQAGDGVGVAALQVNTSPTGLSPKASGKPAHGGLTTVTVHADATASWGTRQLEAGSLVQALPQPPGQPTSSAAPPQPATERRGSRTSEHTPASAHLGQPGLRTTAIAPNRGRNVQQSASASSRSVLPDSYPEDDFEFEDSTLRPISPGSSVGTVGTTSTRARANIRQQRMLDHNVGSSGRSGTPGNGRSSGRRSPSDQLSHPSSRLGYLATTAATEAKRSRAANRPDSRPSSASPHQQQPPRSPSPLPGEVRTQDALEARVSQQLCRDPADWTVREVCDYLEVIGLGQYRRKFVHNAVNGALLLRLSSEELKAEVGVGPLGHREALLAAVHDLEQHWRQQLQQQAQEQAKSEPAASEYSDEWGGGSAAGSRPASPPLRLADYSMQRAYAQRAKLVRDLEKAEGREAHRRVEAEQAKRVVGQASEEVRKLQASIWELDREMGWEAAAQQQQYHPLDVHGGVAWQPAGRLRGVPRPRTGSPDGRPISPGVSPMSRVSRRIMEAQAGEGAGGSFLDRLSKDIAARQRKAAEAAQRAGRYVWSADEQLEQRERDLKDIQLIKDMVAEKSSALAEALGSDDEERVAEVVDNIAVSFQQDWQLTNDVVAAIRKLDSAGKKAGRLAGALRSAQFMQRLQQDLSTREARLRKLQEKYYKLEAGNSTEQQEKADLAAAQQHFGLLGWHAADLAVEQGDEKAGCDGLLGALLRRAAALQEARQRDKWGVDWEGPQWTQDKLDELQQQHNEALQAALNEETAAAEQAAQHAAGKHKHRQVVVQKQLLPQPGNHVLDTVELLAACRPAEVALLEGLSGYRKLIVTWRAVRAQQFVAFTRRDMEQRKAKAAALERQVYPENTKKLAKEEFQAFFERLMNDTARRAQHRDELAEQAKAEALDRMKGSAPAPFNHKRQQRPNTAAAAPEQPSGGGGIAE